MEAEAGGRLSSRSLSAVAKGSSRIEQEEFGGRSRHRGR